jgi:hypothetical protein
VSLYSEQSVFLRTANSQLEPFVTLSVGSAGFSEPKLDQIEIACQSQIRGLFDVATSVELLQAVRLKSLSVDVFVPVCETKLVLCSHCGTPAALEATSPWRRKGPISTAGGGRNLADAFPGRISRLL